jgi:DNA invertase Pin-like site-specific DNA recombinase
MSNVRAVAYYRKSNEDDGHSIDQQQEWARQACPKEGIDLVREFADQAKKGHETASRTDFHAMLDFCRQQARGKAPIEAIVCWNPNRFSRSDSQETSWFVWEFRKAGVSRIFTASHGWRDFRRMEDRILFNIEQDASSHQYILNLARDATRGRIDAAKEGRPLSEAPYGYRKEYEDVVVKGKRRRRPKRLVPGDPVEVEVVRWLFRSYATTITSTSRLARELNRRGVRPPKRARAWCRQTVEAILKNVVYRGLPVWGRKQFGKFFRVEEEQPAPATTRRIVTNDPAEWIVGEQPHEPLIDPDTFELVQRRLFQNRRNKSPRPEQVRPLAGLLRCGCCGYAMVGRDSRHNSRRDGTVVAHRQYVCSGYNTYGASVCGQNTVREDVLLDVLLRKLQERFHDPAQRRRLRDEVESQERDGREGREGAAEKLRDRAEALAAQINQAARRLLTEDEALLPVLRQQLREMQEEQAGVAKELAALESQPAPTPWREIEGQLDQVVALVGRLVELRRRKEPAAFRDVLVEMINYVELHFEHTMSGRVKRSRLLGGLIHPKGEGAASSHAHCSRKRLLCRSDRLRSSSDPSKARSSTSTHTGPL